jgi:hypothetical protein
MTRDTLFWLYADNYRTYNVHVARKLGSIYAAILLSEIASRYKYHKEKHELEIDSEGNGWFYFTQEEIERRTTMSRKQQDTALEILVSKGLIEKKVMGLPAKRFFRLKADEINKFFEEESEGDDQTGVQTSLSKTDKLDCPKGTNWSDQKGQTAHIYKEPKEEPHKVSISAGAERERERLVLPPIGLKKTYGELNLVKLKDEEHAKLIERFGADQTKVLIDRLDLYLGQKGDKYKSHYATILAWIERDKSDAKKDEASPVAKHRQGSKLAFEKEKDTWKPPAPEKKVYTDEEKEKLFKEYGVRL